jgi:hypothetical protein
VKTDFRGTRGADWLAGRSGLVLWSILGAVTVTLPSVPEPQPEAGPGAVPILACFPLTTFLRPYECSWLLRSSWR